MHKILISSRNPKKADEIKRLLGDVFEVSDLAGREDLPEVEETATTFSGNATLKAVEISQLVEGFVLADDSGLEVEALDGEPGVYSARYSGENATDESNNQKLLRELSQCGVEEPWSARFRCCLVIAKGGEKLGEFNGIVEGSIRAYASGAAGFGYDPLFVPEDYVESFAELGMEVKATLSHRAKALAQFKGWMEDHLASFSSLDTV